MLGLQWTEQYCRNGVENLHVARTQRCANYGAAGFSSRPVSLGKRKKTKSLLCSSILYCASFCFVILRFPVFVRSAKLFNCFQTKSPITWCILKINFESYHDSSKERSYFNRSRLTRKIEKSLNKLLISRATKMQFLKIKIKSAVQTIPPMFSFSDTRIHTRALKREHTFEKGRIFPVLGRYESTFPIRIEKHGHEEGRHK